MDKEIEHSVTGHLSRIANFQHIFKRSFILVAVIVTGMILLSAVNLLLKVTNEECIQNQGFIELYFFGITSNPIPCERMGLPHVGDYFAGVLSILSILWLIIAFTWQASELSEQIKQFKSTNVYLSSRNKLEEDWKIISYNREHLKYISLELEKLEEKFSSASSSYTLEPRHLGNNPESAISRLLEYKISSQRDANKEKAYSGFYIAVDSLAEELKVIAVLSDYMNLLDKIGISEPTYHAVMHSLYPKENQS